MVTAVDPSLLVESGALSPVPPPYDSSRGHGTSGVRWLLPALRRRSHLPQSFPGLRGFVRAWIALDDVLQFLCSLVFLPEFEERVSLLELRGGSLVSAGKILQNQVIVRDCFRVIAGLELNFG